MAIKITKRLFDEIVEHAHWELPHEACGYLLGTSEDDIRENHSMTNADHSPEHFSLVPEEQFAALRTAREKGLRIVGIWHSHPSTPSRPSEEDIRLAFDPDILYFILSLADDDPVLNAFRIADGKTEKIVLKIV